MLNGHDFIVGGGGCNVKVIQWAVWINSERVVSSHAKGRRDIIEYALAVVFNTRLFSMFYVFSLPDSSAIGACHALVS